MRTRRPGRAMEAPTPAEAALADSMLPFWRCIYQAFMGRSRRWNLPSNAVIVLLRLQVHPDDGEPARLAKVTLFPRQTMTLVLDTLEARGLAARSPHPRDRRRVCIALTSKGHALTERMLQDLLAFEAVALDSIPAGSRRLFQRLVRAYADGLTRQDRSAGRS